MVLCVERIAVSASEAMRDSSWQCRATSRTEALICSIADATEVTDTDISSAATDIEWTLPEACSAADATVVVAARPIALGATVRLEDTPGAGLVYVPGSASPSEPLTAGTGSITGRSSTPGKPGTSSRSTRYTGSVIATTA